MSRNPLNLFNKLGRIQSGCALFLCRHISFIQHSKFNIKKPHLSPRIDALTLIESDCIRHAMSKSWQCLCISIAKDSLGVILFKIAN